MARWTLRLARSFCTTGLMLGTIFFAASLTPSLLPRPPLIQGVLSGVSFAAGYGIAVGMRWLWGYLELPSLSPRADRWFRIVAGAICAATALFFLWRASEWQNATRMLMDLEPVEGAQPVQVAMVAVAIFAVVLVVSRLFRWTFLSVSRRFNQVIPRRVAYVLGFTIAVALFWSVANGVLFRVGLRMADASFRQLDAIMESDVARPSDSLKTGSADSLVTWEELGRRGRQFVSAAPDRADLAMFLRRDPMDPIRVYVGLNSAESVEARARLALAELLRVGAFERSALILITPTGTGWIDPAAIESVEYLHGGDIASVAVQYSYLASWLALMTEPGYGAETARALFREVYGHWTSLPEGERPRLYLHGLSLGALNSDLSADLFDIIGDPFHGALWSGPPYSSRTWREASSERHPDSPAWLPRFRDGSIIRFANQFGTSGGSDAEWGPVRIMFLQYASDPVTFFEPRILYRRPEWLDEPRGPDVSDQLRWFPVVTFLQLIADIPASNNAPMGYGHVYAPRHYVYAWRELTDPPDWHDADIDRLGNHLERRHRTGRLSAQGG